MTTVLFTLPLALAALFAIVRLVLRLGVLRASFVSDAPSTPLLAQRTKPTVTRPVARGPVRPRIRVVRRASRP